MEARIGALKRHQPATAFKWTVLGLTLLVLAVFGRTLNYPFVPYDDALNLTENPLIVAPSAAPLHAIWRAPFSKLYIPVVYSVWYGLSKVAGATTSVDGLLTFAAPPFHILNVVLHLWSTLWVLVLLRRYVHSPVAAALGAAVYAVHPMQVEAVAWATGGKDTIFAALAWPALWGFVRFCERGRASSAVWATLCFGFALLAKPTAVVLPGVAMVLSWGLRYGPDKVAAGLQRRGLALSGGWLLLALPLAWMTIESQPPTAASAAISFGQRWTIAIDTAGFYLWHMLLPWPLTVDYGRTPQFVLEDVWHWLPHLGLLAVLPGLLCTRFRPWVLLPSLFILVGLLPVLGFVSFDFQVNSTVADRYIYLPIFGFALALAWAVDAVLRMHKRSRVRAVRVVRAWYGCFAAVVAAYACLSWVQAGFWRSGESLFEHSLQVNPRSPLVHHCYGAALVQAGQLAAALEHFHAALRERPVFRPVQYNLGVVLERQERLEAALDVFMQLQSELKTWPPAFIYAHPTEADPEMFEAPARAARLLKRYDLAADVLRTAQELFPNRPQVYWHQALLAADQGQRNAAAAAFRHALALSPDSAAMHASFGDVLEGQGDFKSAELEYLKALQLQPGFAEAHINFGGLLARQQRFTEAEQHFRRAVAVAPTMALAHVNLAILLEQTGRAEEALSAYKQALSFDAAREDARQGLARLTHRSGQGAR